MTPEINCAGSIDLVGKAAMHGLWIRVQLVGAPKQ